MDAGLLVVIVVLAVIALVVLGFRSRPTKEQKPKQPAQETLWHHDAGKHLLAGGVKPDSVLLCTLESVEGDDYYDCLVGAYHSGKFLRFLMENEEDKDTRGYWHSWDVPWSEIAQVIRRTKHTPPAPTKIRQPDGTYQLQGEYYQARVYRIGHGISGHRFLAPDPRNNDLPYRWLIEHVLDDRVRFAKDTQDDPLYGNTPDDILDEYTLRATSREQREEDEAASRGALLLSPERRAALKAECPEKIRNHLDSKDYQRDLAKYIDCVKGANGKQLANVYTDYTKLIIELTMIGAIPHSYRGLFFYENFLRPANYAQIISPAVKVALTRGMQGVLNWWLKK